MSPSHDHDTHEEPDESFWQLVDAALDERRDPLTDPAVARRLAQDPRSRVAYERLERTLRAVALADARRVPAPHWGLRAAAAAALVAATFAWLRTPDAVTSVDVVASRASATRVPAPDDGTSPIVSCVHSFRVDVVDERPDRRVTTRFDGERRLRTVERRSGSRDPHAGAFVVLRSTTTSSESSGSPAHEYTR